MLPGDRQSCTKQCIMTDIRWREKNRLKQTNKTGKSAGLVVRYSASVCVYGWVSRESVRIRGARGEEGRRTRSQVAEKRREGERRRSASQQERKDRRAREDGFVT